MSVAEVVVGYLSFFPDWLVTLFIAILPFIELRGALPVAILVLKMHPVAAFIFSVLGNMIPVIPILYMFPWVEKMMRKYLPFMNKFFDWLFARTRRKASGKIEALQELGIILFVAIPLPVTGAWTGSLICYLFDLDRKKSLLCVLAGVLIAGCVMLIITYVGFSFGFVGYGLGGLLVVGLIVLNFGTGKYFERHSKYKQTEQSSGKKP